MRQNIRPKLVLARNTGLKGKTVQSFQTQVIAAEGRRSPRRCREPAGLANRAKRLGLRQSSGALGRAIFRNGSASSFRAKQISKELFFNDF
jgi:hypothetical protein